MVWEVPDGVVPMSMCVTLDVKMVAETETDTMNGEGRDHVIAIAIVVADVLGPGPENAKDAGRGQGIAEGLGQGKENARDLGPGQRNGTGVTETGMTDVEVAKMMKTVGGECRSKKSQQMMAIIATMVKILPCTEKPK